jgi:hypothetical protein
LIGGGCKGSNVLSLTVLMVEGLTCFILDISQIIKRGVEMPLFSVFSPPPPLAVFPTSRHSRWASFPLFVTYPPDPLPLIREGGKFFERG